MGLANWPPDRVAVRYSVRCRGNDVYRVENAEILEGLPDTAGRDVTILPGCFHLEDALQVLGVELGGAWAGYAESGDDGAVFTAWQV